MGSAWFSIRTAMSASHANGRPARRVTGAGSSSPAPTGDPRRAGGGAGKLDGVARGIAFFLSHRKSPGKRTGGGRDRFRAGQVASGRRRGTPALRHGLLTVPQRVPGRAGADAPARLP